MSRAPVAIAQIDHDIQSEPAEQIPTLQSIETTRVARVGQESYLGY